MSIGAIKTACASYTKTPLHSSHSDQNYKEQFNGTNGILLESCGFIDTVETQRKHLIQDGSPE